MYLEHLTGFADLGRHNKHSIDGRIAGPDKEPRLLNFPRSVQEIKSLFHLVIKNINMYYSTNY